MNEKIQHTFFYNQKPEAVWDYLTKSELMEQWLMKNTFLPIVGYDFQFITKPIPVMDFDGIVYCKVLEIVPCKKLSYSWKSGPGDKKITVDSIVVWTLTPKDAGTELVLDHSGFRSINIEMFNGLQGGWLSNMKKIGQLITTAQ